MLNLRDIIAQLKPLHKMSKEIFQTIKPYFKTQIENTVYACKKWNRGPKISVNLDKVLDAVYEYFDNGSKLETIREKYQISGATMSRYLKLIATYDIPGQIYQCLKSQVPQYGDLITDTTVTISRGSRESAGFSYKVKGKRTMKIAILADELKIIRNFDVVAGNIDDRTTLRTMLNDANNLGTRDLYADAGYTGADMASFCQEKGVTLKASIKKLRNGQPSHVLSPTSHQKLKHKRPRIEHLNRHLKHFRGIDIRYSLSPTIYRTLVTIGIVIVLIHNCFKANKSGILVI